PPYPILAQTDVRHVGDAIAFVVADTVERAKDAAEAIAVDWEPLPHVIGAGAALRDGAPLVWPDHRSNLAFETTLGDARATAAASARNSFPTANMRSLPLRRASSNGRWRGSPNAASIFSPTVRAATTSPARGLRSIGRVASSRSRSTSSPTWAPISPASRR